MDLSALIAAIGQLRGEFCDSATKDEATQVYQSFARLRVELRDSASKVEATQVYQSLAQLRV